MNKIKALISRLRPAPHCRHDWYQQESYALNFHWLYGWREGIRTIHTCSKCGKVKITIRY